MSRLTTPTAVEAAEWAIAADQQLRHDHPDASRSIRHQQIRDAARARYVDQPVAWQAIAAALDPEVAVIRKALVR